MHERTRCVVAKADVLEGHTAAHRLDGTQGLSRVGLHLGLVEQAEDALGGGQSALQLVHRERELRQGLGGLGHVLEERLEDADGELSRNQHAAREEADAHLRQACEEADGRALARAGKGLGCLGDLRRAGVVAPEGLDDGAARVGLLHLAGEPAQRGLALRGVDQRAGRDHLGQHEGRHGKHQEDARERKVVAGHHDGSAHEGDHRDEQLQKAALQHLGDLVQVVGCTADGVSGLVGVIVGKRQAPDLGRDLTAQAQVQALGKARHDQGLHGVEDPRGRPDAQKG